MGGREELFFVIFSRMQISSVASVCWKPTNKEALETVLMSRPIRVVDDQRWRMANKGNAAFWIPAKYLNDIEFENKSKKINYLTQNWIFDFIRWIFSKNQLFDTQLNFLDFKEFENILKILNFFKKSIIWYKFEFFRFQRIWKYLNHIEFEIKNSIIWQNWIFEFFGSQRIWLKLTLF